MMTAPAPTFALQLATAADPATLEEWLDGAAGGARMIYASGIDLPRETAGVKLVTGWITAGLVRPFQKRDPNDERRWLFYAERSSGDRRPQVPAPVGDAIAQSRDLMRMLRDCAGRGEACPSSADITRRIRCGVGESGRRRARYLIESLARSGRIRIETRERARIVTILAPGRAQGRSTSAGNEQNG